MVLLQRELTLARATLECLALGLDFICPGLAWRILNEAQVNLLPEGLITPKMLEIDADASVKVEALAESVEDTADDRAHNANDADIFDSSISNLFYTSLNSQLPSDIHQIREDSSSSSRFQDHIPLTSNPELTFCLNDSASDRQADASLIKPNSPAIDSASYSPSRHLTPLACIDSTQLEVSIANSSSKDVVVQSNHDNSTASPLPAKRPKNTMVNNNCIQANYATDKLESILTEDGDSEEIKAEDVPSIGRQRLTSLAEASADCSELSNDNDQIANHESGDRSRESFLEDPNEPVLIA
ncbi:unnamed protein product [Protopolystoma xenopodis]|uniref:Uncharacterized protein n=1 Tax=Protopolystoma xenopodis TaxID=117903 RepID=A0A448WU21_9PLAT|nr:unnamed protein product [Protopolystoma xenopodis]